MSTWKQQCVEHKLVQRGIKTARPVGSINRRTRDWLVVYLARYGREGLYVWGEYRSEAEARQALGAQRFYRQFYCHRSVYNLMAPLWAAKNKEVV